MLPLNLRQSLLARCWRCRPQYCDCSSLACRAASICCASHAAASSKAAPPLSGATKFSHCLHEHVSCLARRTIRVRRVRCVSESRRLTAGAAGAAQVGWAVTPSSDGAKANRCCCANESGDARLLAAGRANRDSGGRRQPTDTDGRAEVKSSTRRTSHASATATRRLRANSPPPGRLNMPAGLYQGSRGPWRETQVNRRAAAGA